ncbi:MAG: UDP-N-acetylmuramoyl-L-alanine--D-glutamate ligase [Planctomycetia bacterium]|nr:UDP-N-acetylmuramoyl-L-alanine--D-glutamate ligase [Planctomycetia bacterium]
MPYRRQRATIMGLGHFGGGVAAARWLARQGAVVTVTDLADAETLADSLAATEDVPIAAVHLGGHREEDFREADLVVVNPAVRPGNRFLEIARAASVPLASEIGLFLRACPAPVIGVTGANGKSTTAAMIVAILEADGRRAWLGGNLGGSLLDDLDRIGPGDWVVLELSSFQLLRLGDDCCSQGTVPIFAARRVLPDASAVSPQKWDGPPPGVRVAVVTNCTPNHLDWHGGYPQYVAAKQRILTSQTPDAVAVLGESLAQDESWRQQVRGSCVALLPDAAIPPLVLPGKHNRRNAVYAATAAGAVGCGDAAIRRGLRGFSGLPGRLQSVATCGGRTFYNDTTATTPESTIAALESLSAPIWLLAGGSDKGIDLAPLASAVVAGARGAAFFGATAAALHDLVKIAASDYPCARVSTMSEALAWCWSRSGPGDCIVLSPGCASHDQFQNFRHRGAVFCELVARLG